MRGSPLLLFFLRFEHHRYDKIIINQSPIIRFIQEPPCG